MSRATCQPSSVSRHRTVLWDTQVRRPRSPKPTSSDERKAFKQTSLGVVLVNPKIWKGECANASVDHVGSCWKLVTHVSCTAFSASNFVASMETTWNYHVQTIAYILMWNSSTKWAITLIVTIHHPLCWVVGHGTRPCHNSMNQTLVLKKPDCDFQTE